MPAGPSHDSESDPNSVPVSSAAPNPAAAMAASVPATNVAPPTAPPTRVEMTSAASSDTTPRRSSASNVARDAAPPAAELATSANISGPATLSEGSRTDPASAERAEDWMVWLSTDAAAPLAASLAKPSWTLAALAARAAK
eukprot:6195724-Pleurochrysis_carterae.AAC.4